MIKNEICTTRSWPTMKMLDGHVMFLNLTRQDWMMKTLHPKNARRLRKMKIVGTKVSFVLV